MTVSLWRRYGCEGFRISSKIINTVLCIRAPVPLICIITANSGVDDLSLKIVAMMQEMRAVNLPFLIVLPHERVPREAMSFLEGHLDGKHISVTHTRARTQPVSSVSYASHQSSQSCPWGRWLGCRSFWSLTLIMCM